MDNTEELRCISLCTGYAGLDLGLKLAWPNVRTIVYVEIEAFAVANLVSKMEAGLLDVAPVWTDVKTFAGWPFRDRIHIITAGYPCQPFSVAGKRKGSDDPRHLWPHIERIVEAVKPVWCIFENVPGHLGIGFPEVYRSLRDLGYKVEAGLFTAAEVGAPHKRQRLFILAHKPSSRCTGRTRQHDGRQSLLSARPCKRSQLANTGGTELSGRQGQPRDDGEERQTTPGDCDLWPARPGQPQYEWEEPRVVDNAVQRRHSRTKKQICSGWNGIKQTDAGQAQSRLGRAVDGPSCELDVCKSKGINNVDKSRNKKKKPTRISSRRRMLRFMWKQEKLTKASSEANRRSVYCGMPKLSYSDSHERRYLGQRIKADKRLCDMWNQFLSESLIRKDLLQEMLERIRQIERTEKMEKNGMRVDRLRLLGNGVMPQCAEKAIRELSKIFE